MNAVTDSRDVMSARAVRAALGAQTLRALDSLSVVTSTGSTSADALAATPPPDDQLGVYLADYQNAGRGRRGARWHSPRGSGLCLSIALRMPAERDVSTLSLACGVGVQRALVQLGLRQPMIKWPNDLIVDSRKLGGLLVQMRQIPRAQSLLVIGLGLNVTQVPTAVDEGALLPVCLRDQLHDQTPARSLVAARMIDALWQVAGTFVQTGFDPVRDAWQAADFLCGREVQVQDAGPGLEGVARGVNARGELMIETASGVVAVHAGSVSVRPVASHD